MKNIDFLVLVMQCLFNKISIGESIKNSFIYFLLKLEINIEEN